MNGTRTDHDRLSARPHHSSHTDDSPDPGHSHRKIPLGQPPQRVCILLRVPCSGLGLCGGVAVASL
jgi:hypothetical protein